jgi:tripartite-type tricarboxylate transporter receptor subunit TctC
MRARFALTAFLSLALAAPVAAADPVQDFYAGRQVTLIIGSAPGGGYDVYARAVARHIGRFIPGKPSVVVQNMEGAGSRRAGNYIFSAAPKDGSTFGGLFPGAIMEPLLGNPNNVRYDPRKFEYVGSASQEVSTCIAWAASGISSFRDVFQREVLVGASASGGSSRDFPTVYNNLLGTKFKIVSGYPGTAAMTLAVEQGEVQGICGYNWTSLQTQKPNWVRDKKINILAQAAMQGHPALDALGVPRIWQFVTTDEQRQALELFLGQQVFGRPYMAPPGVPGDRLAALREAFMKTMADPEFLADAKRLNVDISAVSGAEVQALVNKLFATRPEFVARAKNAMQLTTK